MAMSYKRTTALSCGASIISWPISVPEETKEEVIEEEDEEEIDDDEYDDDDYDDID